MAKPDWKGQLAAIGREMQKDVNNTMHQVMFNQPVGPNEPGTPLAPTQQNVTDSLKPKEKAANLTLVKDGDKTAPEVAAEKQPEPEQAKQIDMDMS